MRYVVAVGVVLALAGGLAGVKFGQVSALMAMGKAMAQTGPPPETVATAKATVARWPTSLSAVGSVAPAKGVTVANEAAGVVTAIRFNSGAAAAQGQTLVELDTAVERAQLAAARSRLELATATARRTRALVKDGALPGAQLETDESALRSATAEVAAVRAQIERKTVRAPFAGQLGIRLINVGQYLNPGTPITVLQAVDAVYVDFTLPQEHLPEVAVGLRVHVALTRDAGRLDGTVAAIDPTVDQVTRTIKLRASVDNPGERLRPGMFVNVAVELPAAAPYVVVPATAIRHAAFGDSLFVVEGPAGPAAAGGVAPRRVRQQFVRVGEARGDFLPVLEGVTAGQEVVVAGAFKLRNGAAVIVNNAVRPDAQLQPHPADR